MTVENGTFVRVEVKSSEKSTPEIFPSENERRCAEKYLKDEPETHIQWRLVLFVKKGEQFLPSNVTDKVRDAIQGHNTQDILAPLEWLIRFDGGE